MIHLLWLIVPASALLFWWLTGIESRAWDKAKKEALYEMQNGID
jgi:hypothetical protein